MYSRTKVGILKTWTNNLSLKRFDLGFWQNSKQIFRKLQYKIKFFGEFKAFPSFQRKMILYSSTKFRILKPATNIWSLKRFDSGFLQTLKQIYRELQYREKVFGEFHTLPRFSRKMILYSSTKFVILKHWPILHDP